MNHQSEYLVINSISNSFSGCMNYSKQNNRNTLSSLFHLYFFVLFTRVRVSVQLKYIKENIKLKEQIEGY